MLVDWQRGIALFNAGHFFEAHEALEDVWRASPRQEPIHRHLQGLVQVAVAFHHQSVGNLDGARSVLDRAVRNLDGADGSFPDLDLARLRSSLQDWLEYMAETARHPEGSSPPAMPQILPSVRTK